MASKDSTGDELNNKQDSSEDNFGLPDIEYKPLDQPSETAAPAQEEAPVREALYTEAETRVPESTPSGTYTVEEPKSKAPVILAIVIALVLAIAAYLIYTFVYLPKAEAEKVRKEQLAKEALLKKQREEAERLAKQQEEERRRLEELAKAKPAVGTIETLSARTKRYYVIVTANVDDDLLMDFAKKLSEKGVSTKVIPPFGGKNFYRLAVADDETFALAQTKADAMKADYGGAWVIKY